MNRHVSHSAQAKGIQKVHGTKVAARYLKDKGFALCMAMFVLTGHWPKHS